LLVERFVAALREEVARLLANFAVTP